MHESGTGAGTGSGSSPRRSSSAFIPQRRSSIPDYPLPPPSPVILNSTIRPFRSGKDIVRSIPIFLSEEASGEESRNRDRIGPPRQKRVLPPLDLNFERPRSGMKSRGNRLFDFLAYVILSLSLSSYSALNLTLIIRVPTTQHNMSHYKTTTKKHCPVQCLWIRAALGPSTRARARVPLPSVSAVRRLSMTAI